VNPADGVNGIVPVGTQYRWSLPSFTGTVTGGQSISGMSSVLGLLYSNTNSTQTVTYQVIPSTSFCGNGTAFSVVVSLYTTPMIAAMSSVINSGISFVITPSDVTNGIIPNNTRYSWNVPSFTALISGGQSAVNQLSITGLLINQSALSQTASYNVTPISTQGCIGMPFSLAVIVQPNLSAPTITSFTPSSARTNETITITGTNLNTTTAITLGGTAVASFQILSSTSIAAVVGNGATGAISITTSGGTAALSGFTFIPPSPSIISFAPNSGPVGTLVTIRGSNLNKLIAINIGGVPAIPVSISDSNIVAFVMPGASTGIVSIITTSGTAIANGTYSITISQLPNGQQGPKLEPGGKVNDYQGFSVALSADGNTAVAGAIGTNNFNGSVWVYTRKDGFWNTYRELLTANDITSGAYQGTSVAISADGKTIIYGGLIDDNNKGAAWIFIRNGNNWTQQGSKLICTDKIGAANFGKSVSISADGKTAIVSGNKDNDGKGAAWIFIRDGNNWTQQGSKLFISANTFNFGSSVSLSADGKTALIGESNGTGGAWVFVRNNGIWLLQGDKLIGSGSTGASLQGASTSLSADGNTAIIGGPGDASSNGAAWIFTRNGNSWSQQGNKLVGTGSVGFIGAQQGSSVSISADGNTAIIGGFKDSMTSSYYPATGASWIFNRIGNSWTQYGNKIVGNGADSDAEQGKSVAISANASTVIIGGWMNDLNAGHSGASWIFSYIPPPIINSFTPTSARTQDIVKIIGNNFREVTSVSFGGVAAKSFSIASDSSIVAVVGNGASGEVALSSAGGTTSLSGFTFILYQPVVSSMSSVTCSGVGFSISPVNGINGTVPNGTTYSWSAPQLTVGLTGAMSRSNQTAISGTLLNVTNNSQTAVYTVIPYHPIYGTGAPFTLTITVHPTALINMVTTVTCSGVSFTITPTHGVNGIIPPGTLYSWSVPIVSTPSLTGGQTGFNRTNITGSFINNTNTTQTVTYVVTPTTILCGVSNSFSVIVTVYPTPQISPLSVTICSGNTFTLTPTNFTNGIVPAATRYTWDAPTYSGSITGGNSKIDASTITGTLLNNSSVLQTATYFVSPKSGFCVGPAFTVTVSINPIPEVSAFSITGCRRVTFTAAPTNGNIPSNTLYSWPVPTYTASIVGGFSGTNRPYVVDTFANVSNLPQEAYYILTPRAGNCVGANFTLTVYISPVPVINAISMVTCSGVPFMVSPTNGADGIVPIGIRYKWDIPTFAGTITGGEANNGPSNIFGTLRNTTNTAQTATYIVTPFVVTCGLGDPFTVTLSVQPAAEINAITTVTCSGVLFVVTPTNGTNGIVPGSTLYSWNSPTFTGTVTGGVSATNYPTIVTGNLLNRTNLAQTVTYYVTPRVGNCVGAAFSVIVTLQPTPEIISIAQTTNSGTPFAISPANSLQGIVPFNTRYNWNLPTYSSASVTGAQSAINQANIFGTLTNATNSIQTATYTIIPIAGNCTGATFTVSISLLPTINSPTLTSFSPSSAGTGATITITGTNLNSTSAITLGGLSVASFQVLSSTTISAVVGAGATGAVSVTTAGGTAALSGFIFIYPTPTILSFAPNSGPVGTLVTISGTNLNNPTAINIGGVTAIPVSFSGNTLVAMVMPGATKGAVRVTTSGGIANGSIDFTTIASSVPSIQQGNKFVGTGSVGNSYQGERVALSADGNTAIVGGSYDDGFKGAAWIYTRSGSTWTQQGNKLVGSGAAGTSFQGSGVALSADGNTAIIGGYADDNNKGAAWVFTRNGNSWVQQGTKLVGTGAVGSAQQGFSVALSADGNTATIGGWADDSNKGAVWIFTRIGNTWSQMGNKLVGSGAIGNPQQGFSVALSADGNTTVIGGVGDNTNKGAAWVFIRSSNTWTQQGSKLVGADVVGNPFLGKSVAVSADGNTAILGGFKDSTQGAAWVFTRTGNSWSQQGRKLVATGSVGYTEQGIGVAISADGNTAVIGDRIDISDQGGAWIYTRNGETWTQRGDKISGLGAAGSPQKGSGVAISSDGNTAIIGGPGDDNNKGAAWIFIPAPTPSPVITSFTPTAAGTGNVITIIGTNLTGTTAISLGGTSVASFQVLSSTTVTAVVGNGSSGAINLTTNEGTATINGFNFIDSIPAINNIKLITCSGIGFGITPVNGSNGLVPSNTTYSWSLPSFTGSVTGVQSGSRQPAIFGTIYNLTNQAQTVTYIITPIYSNIQGNPFTLSVTLLPVPSIQNITITTKSGAPFSFTPITAVNGIVPTGTLYSWNYAAVSGDANGPFLTGTAPASNQPTINGRLFNLVAKPQTATYLVLPTGAQGCNSLTFVLTVSVLGKEFTPTILSFSPTSAKTGDTITIEGSDLTGTTAISLGGTSVASFQVLSSTTVTAIVGNGSTGAISLTTNEGIATINGFIFTITAPSINNLSTIICSGASFNITPVNGIDGNVPTGTTYSWSVPSLNPGLSGGVSLSNQSFISGTISNSTNTIQTAVYTVIPSHPTFGSGKPFTVIVNVHPKTIITPLSITGCGKMTFKTIPLTNTNGQVSDSALHEWSTPNQTVSIKTKVPRNNVYMVDTFTNQYNFTQGIYYFESESCMAFNYTMRVYLNPIPSIKAITSTNCSGVPFVITPANGINGIVPDSISYSWNSPILSGSLTGGNSGSNFSNINGQIFNPSNVTQTATYFITPISTNGNCVGAAFTLTVSVSPSPVITPKNITTSSGIPFAITPTNGLQNVVPENTLYSWSLPIVTASSIVGAQNATGKSNIFGSLTNNTVNFQTATYSVIPQSGTCIGNAFTVSVTINPNIFISSFAPASAGTGAMITIRGKGLNNLNQISFGGTAASSFTKVSDSTATAIVGVGSSGFVKITSAYATDSLGGFTYGLPVIRLFSTDSTLTFGAEKGKYSRAMNYSVSANYLQNALFISAPDNFQVSRFQDSAFSSSLSINHQNGTIDSTKIFVRFKLDTLGSFTGSVVHTSLAATTRSITVTGSSKCDSVVYITPIVNNILADTVICFKDSLVLSTTSGTFNNYLWSTGDTTKNLVVKSSGTYSLQVGSGKGCLSNVSRNIKTNKNTNAIPSLALIGNKTLISSNAPKYRWLVNNTLIPGNNTNSLVPSKVGFYAVETTNDSICWDRSTDYPIFVLSNPLVNDTLAIKVYPNPTSTGTFYVVATLQRSTNVVARVTVVDGSGNVLLQTNKFIFFGREVKIPITLAVKGTVFAKIDVNGDVKTQTIILQ
jgi:hypothetical protein